jgi:hypothetical protein
VKANELAVDRQREDCLALCADKGWHATVEYCDNDRSASNGKPRPRYQQMLKDIKAGRISAVVVYHQDRLHRDVRELLTFAEVAIEHDLKLATVTGDIDLATDDGEFMATIGAAVARKETRRKSARQKRAGKQRAEKGGVPWWPSRPFGFDADPDPLTGKWITTVSEVDPVTGTVVKRQSAMRLHPQEAKLLRKAYRDFNAGSTLYAIAARWNKAGVKSPRGNTSWTGTRVRCLLLLGRNAGLREYDGEVVGRGSWPAIVKEETWRKAHRLLTDAPAGPYRGRKWLLSGIALCGVCGHPVTSRTSARGKRQYACIASGCFKINRDGEKVDAVIIETVVRRLAKPDAVELLLADEPEEDAETQREQRRALEDGLARLGKDFATAPATFRQSALAEIQEKLDAIDDRLQDQGKVNVYEGVIGAKDVRKAFDRLDLGRQRTIVDALMTITINTVGKGTARVFDPDAIDVIWKEDV